jgi:L-ascorbate metabolism protein UlaG (beta-lactamase superfamily)
MANKKYEGPQSDHFDGVRFFVPGHASDKTRSDLFKMLFSKGRAKWPSAHPSPFAHKPLQRVAGLRSTFIGHASFLLQVAGRNILIDPVFADRASPFQFAGPKRVNAPGIALAELPPIDAVLLTHNHYDHLDKASIWQLEKSFGPVFIGPLGIDHDLAHKGRKPKQLALLDWHQSFNLGDVVVHAVPTYHWSARGMGDRRESLWCSFVIETPHGAVYHIGDTGYGAGQFSKDVQKRFGAPRLAHIPIGAYEPRWFMRDAHVNPEEAVQIFADCGATQAIGHHWGTFQLTHEAIMQPHDDLQLALAARGFEASHFQAFRPGQCLDVA